MTDINEMKVKEKKKKGKSLAKANGLKSIVVLENEIQLTSFDKGYKSQLEKKVKGETVEDVKNPATFSASINDDKKSLTVLRSEGNMKPAIVDMPAGVRQDLIGAKSALETKYFGAPQKDNIHVQIAYNIMDIEKILAEYIDNIIYSIENVTRMDTERANDLIDFLGGVKYEKFKDKTDKYEQFRAIYTNKNLMFFGNTFYGKNFDLKTKKTVTGLKDEKTVYYMLSMLGRIRQFTKHGKTENKDQAWLYNLDKGLLQEEKDVLNSLILTRTEPINKDFVKNSKKDLTVATKAVSQILEMEKKKIVESYYGYVVKKEARNLGFCIRTLREFIVDDHFSELRETKYDSSRSKIYKQFDFVLYSYYQSEEGKNDKLIFVDDLRKTLSEEDKAAVYKKRSERIWERASKALTYIKEAIGDGDAVKNIEIDETITDAMIDRVKVDPSRFNTFVKLLYFMGLFLDGKEINDLYTSISNKIENIDALYDNIIRNQLTKFDQKATYNYTFFATAGRVPEQIRTIKSISKMEAPLPDAKIFMFYEALKLVGAEDGDAGYKEAVEHLYGSKRAAEICSKEKKNKRPGEKNQDEVNKLRNFISKNLMSSSRFIYLVRYTKAENAKLFAKNKAIVSFVLKKMPDTQIDRYLKTCGIKNVGSKKSEKVEELAKAITSLDFRNISEESIDPKKNPESRQRQSAIMGLYLTVIYLIVKNLVRVNSIYTMAIHAHERDAVLFDKANPYLTKHKNEAGEEVFVEDTRYILSMTKDYCVKQQAYLDERKSLGKRANQHGLDCIVKSMNVLDNDYATFQLSKMYRNAIAHLGAVNNAHIYAGDIDEKVRIRSYFGLYHYCMQRYIFDNEEYSAREVASRCEKVASWEKLVKDNKSYCKDLLWLLNAQFAYNPPRYKRLSIEDLFFKDDNAVDRD